MDPKDFEYLSGVSQQIASVDGLRRERDERIASLLRYERATAAEVALATGLSEAEIKAIAVRR